MANKPVPQVTGVSPKEGHPGNKLTIRGENLGVEAGDVLGVFVGEMDVRMSLLYYSSKHICVVTPLVYGDSLSIIVYTKSGGLGSSTVRYCQTPGRITSANEIVPFWPEDERRLAPATIERAKIAQPRIEFDMTKSIFASNPLLRTSVPLSDEALKRYCPKLGGSTDIIDPNFNASLFLVKFLKSASYQDLVQLYHEFTERVSGNESEETLFAFKGHLFVIFRALEHMDNLRNEMNEDRAKGTSAELLDEELERHLQDARDNAYALFTKVLERKDTAESARTVVNIMQKHHFLFNLPHQVREDIAQGNHEAVISDYEIAKCMVAGKQVVAFRRVYEDLETVVSEYKQQLVERLLQMDTRLEEKRDLIRYLTRLGVPYDPARKCLEFHKQWLLDRMKATKQEWFFVSQEVSAEEEAASLPSGDLKDVEESGMERPPTVEAVLALFRLFDRYYGDFWKLGCAFFSGQLKHLSGTAGDSAGTVTDSGSVNRDWEAMNLELFRSFASSLREFLLEAEAAKRLSTEWTLHCVNELRACLSRLPSQESYPSLQRVFTDLSFHLRMRCVQALFHKVHAETKVMSSKETWIAELRDDWGTVTALPGLLESQVVDCIRKSQPYVESQLSCEMPLASVEVFALHFKEWCVQAFTGFLQSLQQLAEEVRMEFLETDEVEGGKMFHSSLLHVNKSRAYLFLVNNCRHALHRTLPRFLSVCEELHLLDPESATSSSSSLRPQVRRDLQNTLKAAFECQEQEMLSAYLALKAEPIFGPIESRLVTAESNWKTYPPPKGVRAYVREILQQLAAVHGEIRLLSPALVVPCMQHCVFVVLEELQRCLQALDYTRAWGADALLQLALDLRLLEVAMHTHCTSEARSILNVLRRDAEGRVTSQQRALLDRLLKVENQRMQKTILVLSNAIE